MSVAQEAKEQAIRCAGLAEQALVHGRWIATAGLCMSIFMSGLSIMLSHRRDYGNAIGVLLSACIFVRAAIVLQRDSRGFFTDFMKIRQDALDLARAIERQQP